MVRRQVRSAPIGAPAELRPGGKSLLRLLKKIFGGVVGAAAFGVDHAARGQVVGEAFDGFGIAQAAGQQEDFDRLTGCRVEQAQAQAVEVAALAAVGAVRSALEAPARYGYVSARAGALLCARG